MKGRIAQIALTSFQPKLDDKYELVFVARQSPKETLGLPGHAFVVWRKSRREQKQSKQGDIQAWGFWPPKYQQDFARIKWEGAVVNDLSSEATKDSHIYRLHVLVGKKQFEQSLAVVKAWDSEKQRTYKGFTQNCVHFTAEIGRVVGLRVPSNVDFTHPGSFLSELIDMNKTEARK